MSTELLQYLRSKIEVWPYSNPRDNLVPDSTSITVEQDSEFIKIIVSLTLANSVLWDGTEYYFFDEYDSALKKDHKTIDPNRIQQEWNQGRNFITSNSSSVPSTAYADKKADLILEILNVDTTNRKLSYAIKIPKSDLAFNDYIWLNCYFKFPYYYRVHSPYYNVLNISPIHGIRFVEYNPHFPNSFKIRLSDPSFFNQPPTNTTISTQSANLGVNKTLNLSSYFSDPDGDALTYTASSSNTGVATVAVNGSTLTIVPISIGSTTITVTANDGKGGTKSTTFTLNVVNSKPTITLSSPPTNQTLYENDTLTIDGSATDNDPDQSVTVYYQINNDARKVLATNLSQITIPFNKQLKFKNGKLYDGETAVSGNLTDGVVHTLKVWAQDNEGAESTPQTRTFYVVPNRAPTLTIDEVVPSGNINSDKFTITGHAGDPDANANVKVTYRINSNNSVEVYNGPGGAFSFDIELGQLVVGQNTIVVEVTDNYGAKYSKTIKLNKNEIKTPLLKSTARYKLEPPAGSAKGVLLYIQRDKNLVIDAKISMTLKGEPENFVQMTLENTAPLPNDTTILEDEFYFETTEPKDNIILQIDMTRSSTDVSDKITLIQGAFD